MKRNSLFLVISAVIFVLAGAGSRPFYAAQLSKVVVGCKTFLMAGASFVVTPSSQFTVQATDQRGHVVYTRNNDIQPGRYGGFGGAFKAQPTTGPVHFIIVLDSTTVADLNGDYPAAASCATFNTRNDFSFTDGRLNNAEPWEPIAIYCHADGTLNVLAPRYPGDPNWREVLRLPQRQLALYPAKPSQNTLVASNFGVRVFLLTSGELQVVAATSEKDKDYSFIFGGC